MCWSQLNHLRRTSSAWFSDQASLRALLSISLGPSVADHKERTK
jgi:hypothetical protein